MSSRRTLYLARHGSTVANGRFLGRSDPPLSRKGRAEAQALAASLLGCNVRSILSSSLRRSAETAAIVARRIGVDVTREPGLDEISYGRWDGLTWAEVEQADPELARRKLADWWGVTPPGGERADVFFRRVRESWERGCRMSLWPMLIVAHAGVNAVVRALAQGLELDPGRLQSFEQRHGAVFRVDLHE